jgi:hypothetical protein
MNDSPKQKRIPLTRPKHQLYELQTVDLFNVGDFGTRGSEFQNPLFPTIYRVLLAVRGSQFPRQHLQSFWVKSQTRCRLLDEASMNALPGHRGADYEGNIFRVFG